MPKNIIKDMTSTSSEEMLQYPIIEANTSSQQTKKQHHHQKMMSTLNVNNVSEINHEDENNASQHPINDECESFSDLSNYFLLKSLDYHLKKYKH